MPSLLVLLSHVHLLSVVSALFHLLLHLNLLLILHFLQLGLCVVLLLVLASVAELLLVLAAVLNILLVHLVLQLHSVARDVDLIRLRNDLVAKDVGLARETAEVLEVTCELVNHYIIEPPHVVHVPVSVHWLILFEVIFDKINLQWIKTVI